MKLSILIPAIIFLAFACSKEDKDPGKNLVPVTQSQKKLIQSSNDFGFDLFKQVVAYEDAEENIFLSPLSVSMALGMTLNGARGETYTAMQSTLHFTGMSQDQINSSYRGLIDALPGIDPKTFVRIANSIWYNQNYQISQNFIDVNNQYFDAKVEGLNFSDNTAKDIINQWVSDATEGKIEGIISETREDHLMFLVNAVYFLAEWQNQFKKEMTYPMPFQIDDNQTIEVEMMYGEGMPFGYFQSEEYEAVSLLYGNGQYQFTAILPAIGNSVHHLVNTLNPTLWKEINSQLPTEHYYSVIQLPKFELEYEITLNNVLKAMGMEVAFSGNADFSGMHPDLKLYIDEVKHKTYVRVDEEGTEAAGATSVGIGIVSMPPSIVLNRPFVFIIHEKHTEAILFMGKMMRPEF